MVGTRYPETFELLRLLDNKAKVGNLHLERCRRELRAAEDADEGKTQLVVVADPRADDKEQALAAASVCVSFLERILIETVRRKAVNRIHSCVVDRLLEARALLKKAGCEPQVLHPDAQLVDYVVRNG